MTAALNRVIIFAHDVQLLKVFYCAHFGLTVTEETENEWVVLKTGGMELALHRVGRQYAAVPPHQAETSNIKLVFTIDANIHRFREQLIAAGTTMRAATTFAGVNAIFCDGNDPEGNVFQLQQLLA